jgi:hypothetical protein
MSSLVYICGRGAHEREAPNFPLYHIPHILSRVFAKKYCTNFFPKIDESLCNLPIDFWVEMWYNISVSRGEQSTVEVIAPRKIFKKFFKNPLTNATKCGII